MSGQEIYLTEEVAVQLKGYLDNGDLTGAASYIENNKELLGDQYAQVVSWLNSLEANTTLTIDDQVSAEEITRGFNGPSGIPSERNGRPEMPGRGEQGGFGQRGERPEMPGRGEQGGFGQRGERPEMPGRGEQGGFGQRGGRPEMPQQGEQGGFGQRGGRPEMPQQGGFGQRSGHPGMPGQNNSEFTNEEEPTGF